MSMGLIMDAEIVKSYIAGETSLRYVAKVCGTDHHTVKRALLRNGITPIKAKSKPLSEKHKEAISKTSKGRVSWMKGKKATPEMLYKNMAAHIRFDVDHVFLSKFTDIEKLKVLNRCITERGVRFEFTTSDYIEYLERFYYCDQFNGIYSKWLNSDKQHYMIPSLDHIIPRSKGGTNCISNLQFLTWFENRCKNNMSQPDWDLMKANIKDYFI